MRNRKLLLLLFAPLLLLGLGPSAWWIGGSGGADQTPWTANVDPNSKLLSGTGGISLTGIASDALNGSAPRAGTYNLVSQGDYRPGLNLITDLTKFGEYLFRVQIKNDSYGVGGADTVTYINNGGHYYSTAAITASGTTNGCRGAGNWPSMDINCRIRPPDFAAAVALTSVDFALERATVTGGHGYVDLMGPMRLTTTGTLPAGWALATDYYIRYVSSTVFELSLTRGGAAVGITDAGTGTHTISPTFSQQDYQIGAWSDVVGPTYMARRSTAGQTNYEGRDRDGNITFRADEYGTIRLKPLVSNDGGWLGFGSFYSKLVSGSISDPYFIDAAGTVRELGAFAKSGATIASGTLRLPASNVRPNGIDFYEDSDLGGNKFTLYGMFDTTNLTADQNVTLPRMSRAFNVSVGARGPVTGAVSNGGTFDTPEELCDVSYYQSVGVLQTCVAGSARKYAGTEDDAVADTFERITCGATVASGTYFECICNVE